MEEDMFKKAVFIFLLSQTLWGTSGDPFFEEPSYSILGERYDDMLISGALTVLGASFLGFLGPYGAFLSAPMLGAGLPAFMAAYNQPPDNYDGMQTYRALCKGGICGTVAGVTFPIFSNCARYAGVASTLADLLGSMGGALGSQMTDNYLEDKNLSDHLDSAAMKCLLRQGISQAAQGVAHGIREEKDKTPS
jgi:hypothetical protein